MRSHILPCQNHTLFQTKKAKINNPISDQSCSKFPLGRHIPTPPPPDTPTPDITFTRVVSILRHNADCVLCKIQSQIYYQSQSASAKSLKLQAEDLIANYSFLEIELSIFRSWYVSFTFRRAQSLISEKLISCGFSNTICRRVSLHLFYLSGQLHFNSIASQFESGSTVTPWGPV